MFGSSQGTSTEGIAKLALSDPVFVGTGNPVSEDVPGGVLIDVTW